MVLLLLNQRGVTDKVYLIWKNQNGDEDILKARFIGKKPHAPDLRRHNLTSVNPFLLIFIGLIRCKDRFLSVIMNWQAYSVKGGKTHGAIIDDEPTGRRWLKVMHTNRAVCEITPGVQGLHCLKMPSQGKPCTPVSLFYRTPYRVWICISGVAFATLTWKIRNVQGHKFGNITPTKANF